ncbi:LysR family transcriptional regulator [Nonomuraea sp. SBT364]|uniref:LysR family transcriptional regulator n=1 Tax=Nonomuraea sp. SBT364 TaxID=1580530 RepID=UPI000AB87CBE|nr:LysR family transcriptional regulator [Nonomuraea sp. SBT364]
MDWQEIEAFLAVADELHFGRAADRLGLSQARVSQMIKKLERRVGASLFDRTTRRVSLTPIGQGLLADLAPAHQSVLDSIQRAQAAGRGISGVLTAGFLGPLAGRVLLDVLEALRSSHPDLEVQLRATEVADPCRPLRDNELDLLLTQLPVTEPGITTGPVVIVEPRVLAVSARHPLARNSTVSLEDLATDRMLRPAGSPPRQWLDNCQPWTTPSGRPIDRGPAVRTFQELMTLVAAGQGICTVAAHNIRYHPRTDVAFVPMPDTPPFEFGLVWRTTGQTSRVRAFVEATRRLLADSGGPAAMATR